MNLLMTVMATSSFGDLGRSCREGAPRTRVQGQGLDLAPGFKVYRGRVRISELADQVGVPTSTVRYYERIGLLGAPSRTSGGYRDYDEDAATRLLFVNRARRMGLSCEQIADLLPVWGGADCLSARDRVQLLIEDKQAEIADRITELQEFAAQLDQVRAEFDASPVPDACSTDLSCCVPGGTGAVPVALVTRPARA
jgi:DNA-binding transcriptional MerR regulator